MSCFSQLLLENTFEKPCFILLSNCCPILKPQHMYAVCINKVWYHVLCFLGDLRVTITRDTGVLAAGQSYNLTCIVILDGTTGSPAIEWQDPNNNTLLNSTSTTVENIVMVNNSVYDRTLVFSRLRTSHGGHYTCRAVLGQASAMANTELSVQSACVKLMTFQDTK